MKSIIRMFREKVQPPSFVKNDIGFGRTSSIFAFFGNFGFRLYPNGMSDRNWEQLVDGNLQTWKAEFWALDRCSPAGRFGKLKLCIWKIKDWNLLPLFNVFGLAELEVDQMYQPSLTAETIEGDNFLVHTIVGLIQRRTVAVKEHGLLGNPEPVAFFGRISPWESQNSCKLNFFIFWGSFWIYQFFNSELPGGNQAGFSKKN